MDRIVKRLKRLLSGAALLLGYENGRIEVIRGKLTRRKVSELESVLRSSQALRGEISMGKNGQVHFSGGVSPSVQSKVRNILHDQ